MSTIQTSFTLPNGQRLANRLVKASMTEGLADPCGRPGPALGRLYERWGAGGAGLLLTGNTAVDPHHLERAGNVVITGSEDGEARRRLAQFARVARAGGARVWVQISHAGRQTPRTLNPSPKAPSAAPMRPMPLIAFGTPVAMTSDEIDAVADRFVASARTIEDAGFDGVQIHAAHGYLLSSFLSPLANRRTDRWGGALEDRARLLLSIVERVRRVAGKDFAVSVKLNSADFQRGGFETGDSIRVAGWLDEAGIDMLEISGGTYESPRMMGAGRPSPGPGTSRQAYFVDFAPRVRTALKRSALMVTGGFRTAAAMTAAIDEDGVDLIGIARPLLVEPEAVRRLIAGAGDLRAVEDELRLGAGHLSPRSPSALIRALNGSAAQAWCYEQMDRLGSGLEPETPVRLLRAARAYLKRDAEKRAALLRTGG